MSHNVKIGIVTAAGYTEAEKYYGRLHGLLEAIKDTTILNPSQKENIVIMGMFAHHIPFSMHICANDCMTAARRRIQLPLQIRS